MQNFACEIVNLGAKSGLLFLHGFLGNRDEFRHIGRHFEKSHTVVYGELPGHGKNPIVLPESREYWRDLAFSIVELLQSQPTKKWHVIGYSLGGRVALYLACKYPQLVDRLTLISASPGLKSLKERHSRAIADRLLGQRLAQCSMLSFLSYWYRQPLFKQFRELPQFQKLLKQRLTNHSEQVSFTLSAMSVGTQPPLWEELSRLVIPVELVIGGLDEKFTRIAHQMRERNPKIRLSVVANAGHVVHWEAPGTLIGRIANAENRMESYETI